MRGVKCSDSGSSAKEVRRKETIKEEKWPIPLAMSLRKILTMTLCSSTAPTQGNQEFESKRYQNVTARRRTMQRRRQKVEE